MDTSGTDCLHLSISTWKKGATIYRQGDTGKYWYEVIRGFVRLCHYFGDGRRQVSRFAGRGDAFGFEIGMRQFSAEALTDTGLVCHAPSDDRTRFPAPGEQIGPHPALQRALTSAEDTMRLFSYNNAVDRVAVFLMKFNAYGDCADIIELPMSRQDLADHLGLTMHTVSRSISDLVKRGYFVLERPDRLRIANRAALERLVEFERIGTNVQLVA